MRKLIILLEIICLIISALATVSSILSFWTSNQDNDRTLILIILYVTIGIFSIIFIKYIFTKDSKYTNSMKNSANLIHIFCHYLRNYNYREEKARRKYQYQGLHGTELYIDMVTKTFRLFLIERLNNISSILSELTGIKVNSCIKLYFSEIGDYIFTFCRDSNTDEFRKKYDGEKIKLSDNTDFLKIVEDEDDKFAEYRLITYSKKNEYRNSNKKWRDIYKNTIVVPIRIKNEYLSRNVEEKYHIIGFLCVDSNSNKTFTKSTIIAYTDLLKSFADSLYYAFDIYKKNLSKEQISNSEFTNNIN